MRLALWLMIVLFVSGSCRDLTIPERQVSRVTGRVVANQTGDQVMPVSGARVVIAGSTLQTKTSTEGVFELEPIQSSSGTLVIEFDENGDGINELARSFDFATWGIRPNRDTALGTLSLRSSTSIGGRVTLKGVSSSENTGTDVFIPGLAVATVTSDLGGFLLTGVPEGTFSIAASHQGYATKRIDGVQTSSGTIVMLGAIELLPAISAAAHIVGTVEMTPATGTAAFTLTAVSGSASEVFTVTPDRRFSGSTAQPRVTLVAHAAGYDDAVLPNVVPNPGSNLDVGVLRLTQGQFVFDAGRPPQPHDPACGDGVVASTELCDDGNVSSGDGCSATCTREQVTNDGVACLEATPLTFVPISGGETAASLRVVQGVPTLLVSRCLNGSSTSFAFVLTHRTRIRSVGGPYVSLRRADCGSAELSCGGIFESGVLAPGRYVLTVLVGGQVELTASAVPDGPWCGDGVISPEEQCDDANPADGDGCSGHCQFEAQHVAATCDSAPLLTLLPTNDGKRGATFSESLFATSNDRDPSMVAKCLSNVTTTQVVRVAIKQGESLFVETSMRVRNAIAVFTGSCSAPSEVSCVNTSDSIQLVRLPSLDAGVYFVAVSNSQFGLILGGTVLISKAP